MSTHTPPPTWGSGPDDWPYSDDPKARAAYHPGPPPVVVNVQHERPRVTPNRVLHATLSILTGGVWVPVWLWREHRAKKANDRG